MQSFAILDANGVVINLIAADEDFCRWAYPDRWVLAVSPCDLGSTYDAKAGTFSAPKPTN